ncbi:Peptidase M15D, vanX D-ala-D-ala dipeptidase [Candidatus Magnetoovum chiemensis]|nr:Peptidase M15D, vanX D-ala-D-ala dipeptidase [Candidatus Magnetoovum chiemensis]
MEDNNYITINSINFTQYIAELTKLYAHWSKPYFLKSKENGIHEDIKNLFKHKDAMMIAKTNDKDIIGLCFGFNAACAENDSLVKSIAENQDIKDFYYIAALIVNPASKDENIKAALIEQLILSNLNNYSIFLTRIEESDSDSIKNLFCEQLNFKHFDKKNKSADTEETSSETALLYLNRTIKKVTYMELLKAKVNDCGEELTNANRYDKEITLQKAEIGKFPYSADNLSYYKVRDGVAKKLADANRKLLERTKGKYRLAVFYGYRHIDIQRIEFVNYRRRISKRRCAYKNLYEFIETVHRNIAVPNVAGHPTGAAIDVTIMDAASNSALDMGTMIYETTSDKVVCNAKGLTIEQIKNRQILYNVMTAEGFAPYWGQWWHYSYGDRQWAVYYDKPSAIYGILP